LINASVSIINIIPYYRLNKIPLSLFVSISTSSHLSDRSLSPNYFPPQSFSPSQHKIFHRLLPQRRVRLHPGPAAVVSAMGAASIADKAAPMTTPVSSYLFPSVAVKIR
jgi:hypothetical protein